MTGRERALAGLEGAVSDRVPVMPITMQFTAAQAGVPYRQYATCAEVQASAQVQVAERFGFDHVSVISDPATEAADLGARVHFPEDATPTLDDNVPLIGSLSWIRSLRVVDPGSGPRMSNRLSAVSRLKEAVGDDLLVEGWVEGPCAEAADLRGLSRLMMDFYDEPETVEELLDFTLAQGIAYARAQIAAGADCIGIGDAVCSLIGPGLFEEFVLHRQRKLVEAIRGAGAVPKIHICGNTLRILAMVAQTGASSIDVDYPVGLARARMSVGPSVTLAGDLDPVRVVRNGSPSGVRQGLDAASAAAGPRFIAAAGCEIPRDTPVENVLAFHDWSLSSAG